MNLRRKYIQDVVAHYIKTNKEDYETFLKEVEERRKIMLDSDLGKLRGESQMRLAISVPEKLWAMIAIAFVEEEKKFGEEKGEMKWFTNKFKQFLIPNEY